MTEAEWLVSIEPLRMLECPPCQASSRKRRLFVVACCRRVSDLLTDKGSAAVDAAEQFADGTLSQEELHAAWVAVGFPRKNSRHYAAAAARAVSCSPGNDFAGHGAACVVKAAAERSPADAESRAAAERTEQVRLLRDLFGNPFCPVSFDPRWLVSTVLALAQAIYDERAFDHLPILADALEEAGCASEDILAHCRGPGAHVRGCWILDLLLGKK